MSRWVRWWSSFPLVWGRMVMPLALMTSMWAAFIAVSVPTNQAMGRLLSGPVGEIIGVAAASACLLLVCGWCARSMWALRQGLLLSACFSGGVTATLVAEFGPLSVSAWLASPWIVGCGLSWLIEVRDHRARP